MTVVKRAKPVYPEPESGSDEDGSEVADDEMPAADVEQTGQNSGSSHAAPTSDTASLVATTPRTTTHRNPTAHAAVVAAHRKSAIDARRAHAHARTSGAVMGTVRNALAPAPTGDGSRVRPIVVDHDEEAAGEAAALGSQENPIVLE
jgi:hypothetical protein